MTTTTTTPGPLRRLGAFFSAWVSAGTALMENWAAEIRTGITIRDAVAANEGLNQLLALGLRGDALDRAMTNAVRLELVAATDDQINALARIAASGHFGPHDLIQLATREDIDRLAEWFEVDR